MKIVIVVALVLACVVTGTLVAHAALADEAAGFTLSKTTASVTEGVSIDTFTVVLLPCPPESGVMLVTDKDLEA